MIYLKIVHCHAYVSDTIVGPYENHTAAIKDLKDNGWVDSGSGTHWEKIHKKQNWEMVASIFQPNYPNLSEI